MPHFEKHFTVEEATALLPELRLLLAEVRRSRDALTVVVEGALPVLRRTRENGGGQEANDYLSEVQQLNRRLQHLNDLGVQIKDLDKGLVDFPHWREGEEVFLCWHLGEESIRYWHSLESGFPGRESLE